MPDSSEKKHRKSPTRSTKRLHRHTSLTAMTLVLMTSACVVSAEGRNPEGPSTMEPTNEVGENTTRPTDAIAAAATTTTDLGSELKIEVLALENLANNILRLRIRITNNSTKSFSMLDGLSEKRDSNTASDITLIDAVNQKKYLSYDLSDGNCFCSSPLSGPIRSGESEELWVTYPGPPDGLESMTVIVPLTPPIIDVPISTSQESLENEGLREGQKLDLTMISDGLDDQTGRTESGDEVSIILSSDVLFETGSSRLNTEAQDIIEQVALEIDDSSSLVVNIDGHADNTGRDEVNIPLSEERAQAVEEILSELVTREGVTFETEGHGSSDPIAENSTEEGRERNRRVSVTFKK
ncbi:OmpA family protein [Nocardiopsis lambiniae]|uniref:OmpA family protein n=1 Tax=Nocardiopsis lambiniae TaxID=3075539 RepID=A0ABU2M5Y1_9ACTN|nr:OmpA family protein [Nocardiopsis sp. DSM 44743]MDT0327590.1 OmpA family protein [Nocardiopsis sp. DSM 44743]